MSSPRERWVSLRKILTSSISSLFLRVEHKLSFVITFLSMIEPSDVASKLLLWICLVLTMTWLNSFAFEFLGSGWNISQSVSLPNAKIVLDRFHIVQHLSRAMSRVRVQIMNQLDRKSHEYKAIKLYWKLIQQDRRKLSDKRFYRPTFRMHLTNKKNSR